MHVQFGIPTLQTEQDLFWTTCKNSLAKSDLLLKNWHMDYASMLNIPDRHYPTEKAATKGDAI